MKLRTKLFLIFSILAAIPLLILTLYAYSHYRDVTYQRMDDLSDNLFQNAVTYTDNQLDTVQRSIRFLTFYSNDEEYSVIENIRPFAENNDSFDSYDIFRTNQHLNAIFQNIMASYDYITGIYVFTPADVVFSCSQSSNTISGNYSPVGRSWYENTRKEDGQFYISTMVDPDIFINSDPGNDIYFSLSISDLYSHEFLGVILVLERRKSLSEFLFTIAGIAVTALIGYIFKLKRDGKSKDNIINAIAKELTGIARSNAEEKIEESISSNTKVTKERIEFLNALEKAKHEMDGVDEEDCAVGLEKHKPSTEATEEVGGFTSDPLETPSILKDEDGLSDEIRELSKELAGRIKERLNDEK